MPCWMPQAPSRWRRERERTDDFPLWVAVLIITMLQAGAPVPVSEKAADCCPNCCPCARRVP